MKYSELLGMVDIAKRVIGTKEAKEQVIANIYISKMLGMIIEDQKKVLVNKLTK
jgi:hypothetical protein